MSYPSCENHGHMSQKKIKLVSAKTVEAKILDRRKVFDPREPWFAYNRRGLHVRIDWKKHILSDSFPPEKIPHG